jgi:LysR family hydrogen peroxide-inducible transcriptional activator
MKYKLPNLRHLEYLLALHTHRHFHRAAQECFVSQSTLSSAILKLEEQLGCQLIERDHKAFIFTSEGEEVVKRARQLLFSARELVDFAVNQGQADKGVIRIGCIATIAPFLLTELVKACEQQLPDLELFLEEDTTEKLMERLGSGDIDVLILALPVPRHGFQSKSLAKDPLYYAGEPALVKELLAGGDYSQLPAGSVFLLSQEHCLSEHATSACQLADSTRINDFTPSSVATLVQMTAHHKGITFLPKMAVNCQVGVHEGLSIAAIPGDVYREIGMLWRKTSLRARTYKNLADIVSALLQEKN